MSGYLVANYRITYPDAFKNYLSVVGKTLAAVGAEVIVADYASEAIEGDAQAVTIVAKFASKDAVRDWYQAPEYQNIVHHRIDNTEGLLLIADGFKLP